MAVNTQAPVSPAVEAAQSASSFPPAQPADQPAAPPPFIVQPPEQAPVGRDWFRDSMNRVRGYTSGDISTDQPARPPETPPASEQRTETAPASTATRPGTPPAPQARAFTQDEINRMVQAETDRRLDKHNREEAARRQRAAAEAAVEQERDLRRKDPYGYARMMEAKEVEMQALQHQLKFAQTHVLQIGAEYDRSVLDPIVTAVPIQVRQALLQQTGDGIEGRGALVQASLKTLEKHWREQGYNDARKRLGSDQAFIKEILTRYGGTYPEPDSTPSIGAAPGGPVNMNDRLRLMAGRR